MFILTCLYIFILLPYDVSSFCIRSFLYKFYTCFTTFYTFVLLCVHEFSGRIFSQSFRLAVYHTGKSGSPIHLVVEEICGTLFDVLSKIFTPPYYPDKSAECDTNVKQNPIGLKRSIVTSLRLLFHGINR